VLTLTVEGARALVAWRLLRRSARMDPTREHRRLVALAVLSGLCISLAGIWFFPELSMDKRALLGGVLFAIPAAGAAVSMSSPTIIGVYAVGVTGPAIAAWCLLHPDHAWGLSTLGLLYTGLLVLVSMQTTRMLRHSLTIRHQRDQMVLDLERRNADVRAAMARAEEAARARSRVLAAASHDLRQPLHALSIYSAILAARPTAQTLQEVGQNIDQIVRSLGALLTGLLDLSRLSTGHYVAQRERFDLQGLLNGLCDEFSSAARERGLVLERRLEPSTVDGDSTAIARIVRNLLDNAIKYTDHGHVQVQCASEDGDALVQVKDTGRGIAAAEQERVFEEFYQIDNPGRDRSRGVGLGLAIVQRLCELIGARITLVSVPGQGTRFTLVLPGALVPARWDASPTPPIAQQLPVGRRIYVVDDEGDILASMATLLTLWQAQVRTAIDAAGLRRLFAEHGRPDLLIADLRLGRGEHGARLATELRERHGPFPVLIVTGETASAALGEANAAGYPVLLKPLAAESLRQAIAAALDGI